MKKSQKKCRLPAIVSFALFIIACSNPGSPGPATYRVTYNANGGTGSVPTDTHSYLQGATLTTLGNTGNMTKTGYLIDCSFAGWNTKADGSGTSYAEGATFSLGSADVTLYVVWLDNDYIFASSGTNIVITGNNCQIQHGRSISGGVTRIGDNAFQNCVYLDLVIVPSSVTSIGQNAFQGCTKLSGVDVMSTAPPVLASGSHAFDGCMAGFIISVPAGAAALYKNATGWSDYESIIQ